MEHGRAVGGGTLGVVQGAEQGRYAHVRLAHRGRGRLALGSTRRLTGCQPGLERRLRLRGLCHLALADGSELLLMRRELGARGGGLGGEGVHLLEECLPMRDAIRGHHMQSEAIRGHQRPSKRSSEAIRSHQRPSEAIREVIREAIRSHERPSAAM